LPITCLASFTSSALTLVGTSFNSSMADMARTSAACRIVYMTKPLSRG
jgi:hypothetical protein